MENATPTAPRSGLAIASLICGISGFITLGLASIAAIICGVLALKNGQSKGMAIAGLVTGGISLFILPVAIIAAIAIPNLMESRVTANEACAAASLKSGFFPAQVQFRAGAYQDADENNVGEYGLISELTGRTRTNKMDAGAIHLLTGPLAKGPGFIASGYNYAIYLPDGTGAISDISELEARHTRKVANASEQEQYWVAYAWPVSKDTGHRVFAICSDGQIRSPTNDLGGRTPAWNDVFGGRNDWNQPTWPIYHR